MSASSFLNVSLHQNATLESSGFPSLVHLISGSSAVCVKTVGRPEQLCATSTTERRPPVDGAATETRSLLEVDCQTQEAAALKEKQLV